MHYSGILSSCVAALQHHHTSLACDLHYRMGLEHASLPVILSLIDQLSDARHHHGLFLNPYSRAVRSNQAADRRTSPDAVAAKLRQTHRGPALGLRIKGRDGIARAFYVTATGQRLVIVRVFTKKTQKTPPREIKLAKKRAEEVT